MKKLSLVAVLSVACTTQLQVPAGATITCSNQDECPDDRICSQALRQCVSKDSDGKPPVIESLTTSVDGDGLRTVAAPGARIQLDLSVDEPLGRDPSVELVWADASANALRDAHTGNDWTFIYDVVATNPEGFVSIIVTVVDVDGLPTSTERPRALYIDKTPPEISVDWSSLIPAADNPHAGAQPEVDAGRAGTVLEIGLLLNEPVRAVPLLTAVQTHDAAGNEITGTPATFDLDTGTLEDETLFFYAHTLTGPLVDGTYGLETAPTDDAGNTPAAPLVLGETLIVDSSAPTTPPDTTTPGVIHLQRIPWGSGATASGSTFPFMVIGINNAAEEMHTVIAYADGSRQRELETGRGTTDVNGAFGFSIGGSDVPVVWLTQVDAAGNESDPTRINDVTWIATIGPESPHDFEARTWIGNALQAGGQAWQSGDALAPGDNTTVPTSGRAPGWFVAETPAVNPPGVINHVMAYDTVRGRIVLHGGSTNTYTNETWEWDGQVWELACGGTTLCEAPAGASPAMAFDAARGEMVLYGGESTYDDRCTDHTWLWNGERWRLVSRGPGDPPGLCAASATYDAVRGKVVLFGGHQDPFTLDPLSDGLWEWDGDEWSQRCGGSTGCSGPSARTHAALAFDHANDVTVLFGGNDGAANDETWLWNGAIWQQRCTGGCTRPLLRSRHAMASSPTTGVWLMGGSPRNDELWSWNGTEWQPACGGATGCAGPSPRNSLGLAVDEHRGAVVLFGGAVAGWPAPPSDETWEWRNGGWAQRSGASAPSIPAMSEHAMVYSSIDDRIVLQTNAGETWEWDGALGTWQLTCGGTTGCVAPIAASHAMVYDPDLDQVLLFGGIGSDQLQLFDGGAWNLVCGTGSGGCSGPSARNDHAIAYDTVRDELIVFGGYDSDATADSDQTWIWDPTNNEWRLACGQGSSNNCGGPSARTNTSMAFDEVRGVAVLHGGNTHDDTWEWNGNQWNLVCATRADCQGSDSVPIWNHTMAYSAGRGTVLLFGGFERIGKSIFVSFDLWEWDGTAWTQLCGYGTGCVGPGARFGHAAAYDRQRSELVIAGGEYAGVGTYDDTWRFRDGAIQRPAQILSFHFGEALERTPAAPDPFACLHDAANCLLRSVTVRATTSGTFGDGSGNAAYGTQLLAWQDNAWRELGSYTGSATPTPILFTLDAGASSPDPAIQRELGGLLLGRDHTITLALTPDGDNGTLEDFGAIETDTVELEIRYRLP